MHRARLLIIAALMALAGVSQAQTATGETLMLDLPRASQHATVTQRIGITDITINYHRPLVAGRVQRVGVDLPGQQRDRRRGERHRVGHEPVRAGVGRDGEFVLVGLALDAADAADPRGAVRRDPQGA